jgi:DNA repair protein RAD5
MPRLKIKVSGRDHRMLFSHSNHSVTAIDRVHRIGQEKTVYVKHFIVSSSLRHLTTLIFNLWTQIADTIEGRILQIQKRKTAIVKEAFRGKGASGADSASMENLKIMFGDV